MDPEDMAGPVAAPAEWAVIMDQWAADTAAVSEDTDPLRHPQWAVVSDTGLPAEAAAADAAVPQW